MQRRMDIKWENPPPTSGRGATPRDEEVEMVNALRARPNDWARLFMFENNSQASTRAQTIRRGQRSGWKVDGGHFDVVTRKVETGIAVYVRYVPAPERSDTD